MSSSDRVCRRERTWAGNLSASRSDEVRAESPGSSLERDCPERKVAEQALAEREERPRSAPQLAAEGGVRWDSVKLNLADLKAAEAALRRSEERYRAFVENSDDIIFQCSPQGHLLFLNPAGARLFGYRAEQLNRRSLFELMRPEILDATVQHLQLILQSRRRQTAEFAGTMEGHLRVFFTSVVPLFDASGAIESLIGMARDITDQRRTEQVLLKKEMLLRETGRMARVGGWECDLRELTLVLSEEVYRVLELPTSAEVAIEQALASLPPESLAAVWHLGAQVSPDNPRNDLELQIITSTGRRCWIRAQCEVVYAGAEPIRLRGTVQDIDDRKQAEFELRSRSAELALALDQREEAYSLLDGLFSTASVGLAFYDTELRCVRINQYLADLTYRPSEQHLGRRPGEVAAELGAMLEPYLLTVIASQAPQKNIEWAREYPPGSGQIRHCLVTFYPVQNTRGHVLGVGSVVMEITDQKRAETARLAIETKVQQAQKLESLGVLSGGIAHDFNNILTGILGYADLALLQLGHDNPAAPSIDQVVLAARRAAELTRQLLAYSGKGQFIVEPIHLGELVREMSQLLGLSISRKCVLRLELDPKLPCVSADASQMRQVVMNLLLNASEAIGDRSGTITMRLGSQQCDREWLAHSRLGDELPAGLYVCIEVTDDGCGMPPETLAKIFDPFFTTKFTGRGLGLSAVLGIVRGHRGAIKVSSEVGVGTRFSVYLPAIIRPELPGRAPRQSRRAGFRGSGAVLVVDDEEAVRGLARSMLSQMGFEVLCARDGVEAVQVVADPSLLVRLVLLDLTMPRMDGEETLNALRAMRPELPVILSSGYNDPADGNGTSPRGANGFIQKPYLFDQLTEVVRKVLSGKRPRVRKPVR